MIAHRCIACPKQKPNKTKRVTHTHWVYWRASTSSSCYRTRRQRCWALSGERPNEVRCVFLHLSSRPSLPCRRGFGEPRRGVVHAQPARVYMRKRHTAHAALWDADVDFTPSDGLFSILLGCQTDAPCLPQLLPTMCAVCTKTEAETLFISSWNDIREAGGPLGKVRSFVPASQRVAFSGRAAACVSRTQKLFFLLGPLLFFRSVLLNFYEVSSPCFSFSTRGKRDGLFLICAAFIAACPRTGDFNVFSGSSLTIYLVNHSSIIEWWLSAVREKYSWMA